MMLFQAVIIFLVVVCTLQYFCLFKNEVKDSYENTYYKMQLMDFEGITPKQVQNLNDIDEVDFAQIIFEESFTEKEEPAKVNDEIETETTYTFMSYGKMNPRQVFGMTMGWSEFNQSDKLIIIPGRYLSYHGLEIGDPIELMGQTFTVAGAFDNWSFNQFILPVAYSIGRLQPQSFYFEVPVKITEEGFSEIAEKLSENFERPVITPDYNLQISQDSARFMDGAVMAFAFGAVCVTFFYQYLLKTRKRQLSIYMILGSGTGKIIALLLTEIILLFSLCFLIGALASNIIGLLFDLARLNAAETLQFYLYYLVLYLIIASVFCAGFLRKITIQKYRESGVE